ncbi:peptide synthetase [Propionicimonas sp.]|uniref:peptide synthetase n=1 Tax=Propionicimonas sp. TaxID=1955623 RepID=UPI0039E2DE1D
MRLTNVARMALPQGRLLSCAVLPAPGRGRELPVSFDQGRHVGLGQRPGSWMAVSARLPDGTGLDDLAASWFAVLQRHATFSTAFSHARDGRLQLHEITLTPGRWTEHPVPEGDEPRAVLRRLFDQACAPFEVPSHRLAVMLPSASEPDPRPLVIVGADHAHIDMWSFVIVLEDLFACLADLRAGRPPGTGLPPAAGFAEHTAALEAMPPAPPEVHQRWAEILDAEAGVMPKFPLSLGDPDFVGDSMVDVRDLLDADQAARFADVAGQRGVRTISLAVSVLTQATLELAGTGLRAVFPVHSRHEERWRNSVGWYITNSVIESDDPDPAACARAVREAIALGSYPLAPILAPYGGMRAAPGMFAISWLDTRRLPALPVGADPRYVSAVVRDDGVMVWFIVNDSGLHLRARYPRTPQAVRSVRSWLDRVESGMHALAARG